MYLKLRFLACVFEAYISCPPNSYAISLTIQNPNPVNKNDEQLILLN